MSFLVTVMLVAASSAQATIVRIEETAVTLVGNWFTEALPDYSHGTSVYANFDVLDPGAYATFTFDGTGVIWIGARTFNAGLFDWIVDEGSAGERRGTLNTFILGVNRFTTELLVGDLAVGEHTFKFISLGINGDTLQPGLPSETYIDAFDIVGSVPAPSTAVLIALGLWCIYSGAAGVARSGRKRASMARRAAACDWRMCQPSTANR